jgi:hypothetical protein
LPHLRWDSARTASQQPLAKLRRLFIGTSAGAECAMRCAPHSRPAIVAQRARACRAASACLPRSGWERRPCPAQRCSDVAPCCTLSECTCPAWARVLYMQVASRPAVSGRGAGHSANKQTNKQTNTSADCRGSTRTQTRACRRRVRGSTACGSSIGQQQYPTCLK